MSNLQSIIAKANTAVGEPTLNIDGGAMEHRKGDSTFEITSSIRGPTINSPEAISLLRANLPADPYEIDVEAIELMEQLAPNGTLVNPQYFAQTANRRGFTYHYINAKGHNESIKFESGVYVTHDPWLVNKLNSDIARQSGLSAHIANISASTYNDMVLQARAYRAMAGGMTGSNQGSAHKMAAEAEKQAMIALLADQKRQISELQNQVTGNNARTATADTNITAKFQRTSEDRAVSAQRVVENSNTQAMLTNILNNTGKVDSSANLATAE
jgi:hypothetical protein